MFAIHKRIMLVALGLSGVTVLPSLGQQLANLTCFDVGLVGDCSSFVDSFCSTSSALSFLANNSVSQCFENSGSRCDFTGWKALAAPDSKAGPFDATNCEFALQIVSAACTQGGSAWVVGGGTVWTLNPDAGSCGDTSAVPGVQPS